MEPTSPSEPGSVETCRVLRKSQTEDSCRGRNGSRGADGVFQSTELALRYACEKVLPVHGQPKYSSCHRDGTGKQNIFHPASNCRNIPPADCSSQEVRGGDCFRRPKLPRDEVHFGVCDAKAQVLFRRENSGAIKLCRVTSFRDFAFFAVQSTIANRSMDNQFNLDPRSRTRNLQLRVELHAPE